MEKYRKSEKLSNIATLLAISALIWASLAKIWWPFIILFVVHELVAIYLVIKALQLHKQADRKWL